MDICAHIRNRMKYEGRMTLEHWRGQSASCPKRNRNVSWNYDRFWW